MTLTHREKQCLEAIKRLTVDGVTPTFDELCADLGLASKSGIFRMVESLEHKGYIRRTPRVRNSIEVINPLAVEIARLVDIYGVDAVRKAVAA